MCVLTAAAGLALGLSLVYTVTHRPLTPREVRGEIVRNCFLILALAGFLYKLLYVC